ncbi:MAG: ATP-binding protein [Gammaproteobacteria bacterium]|nr:ATP-binding protein [Gammaproteobacteria bacterium]MYF31374.1 ATP-binding protein [Gammaproteobacteria bacterium]MYK45881.1 ATP-binding protein [Gammaproteobacteria bacterium]
MSHLSSPIPRYLNVREILDQRSCLLFGPRQTGKSTLIRQQLDGLPVYNLLDQGLFLRLSRNPTLIREALTPESSAIVIDEIQRMPELLNEVHLMIEEHGIRFFLTGSSARSLRRRGVNLLGGRIRSRRLHPFVRTELGTRFELRRALEYGLLPPIYFSDAPEEDLAAYAGDYLKEEVAAEALVRNVGAFSRFLEVAALAHGEMINFTSMANDAQVPVSTVREYYEILKDTLIAHEVPAFAETSKRKAISTAKYYLFDIGLARHLQGRSGLPPGTFEYGSAFESFVFQEIKAFCDYHRLDTPRYWRSKSNIEVDFLVGNIAVEVKAKRVVGKRDMRGLVALRDEGLFEGYIVVCMEPEPRTVDGIRIMPWANFLDELWGGKLTRR